MFMGKQIYLFEGKEEVCKGSRKLIFPFYFGRLYAGTEQNASLWEAVDSYIWYHYDYAVCKLLTRIKNHCGGSEHAVEECQKYLVGNWEYIQRAFHDKHVLGCSAERHVSSVYSERMSSRPMGRSETGSDRMCKLRCFIRNYGREKVIDLVNYRRERELSVIAETGTDGMIEDSQRKAKQREAQRYAEALHATLSEGSTVRNILAIRKQLGNI